MSFRILLVAAALCAFSFNSFAADHEVRAVGVKFSPMFVIVEPGDTVSWTNMPAHMIESIKSLSPEGSQDILSDMGVDVSYSFKKEGLYVYKCTPHWGARMGGVILVGNPNDVQGTIEKYLANIKADPSLLPAKGLLKKFKVFLQEQESK